MTIPCHSCGANLENYHELALHLDKNRKTHKVSYRTKKWIAKMLLVNTLSYKNRHELSKRVPNMQEKTDFGDENREKARMELSGENEYATTICPSCKRQSRQLLPIEYINSPIAWAINGNLAVLCGGCRKPESREVM